jgi:HAE1 family hydrophobic/amphiphilic exporter-1
VGTNIDETNRIIKYIENRALQDDNALSTIVMVGISEQNAQDSASGSNPAGSYEATLWSNLKTSSKRDISDKEILEKWRQYFPELEKGKIHFMDMSSMMSGGGATSPVEINFFGKDLQKLVDISERVRDRISRIEGIRDAEISQEKSKPEILMRIRKEEASKLGLTSFDISRQVQSSTIGTVVSRMFVEGEELDIRVRLKEKDRETLSSLRKIPVITPMGAKVYLSQIVDFEKDFGPVRIDRENQVRKVSVTANLYKRHLNKVIEDIINETDDILKDLPEGYFYEVGGEEKDRQEAFKTMSFAFLLAIILVYAVMASQFENLKSPFIIMFTIPLAFIGVVFLMVITGKIINLPVFMGFIMMAGIVVNNGIVMVDYINQLIAKGIKKSEAIVQGAVIRLRPILITALSTILGMLPMALASSEGSEMRSPMAIALIGGLLASTFLTLFIIPILYEYFTKERT